MEALSSEQTEEKAGQAGGSGEGDGKGKAQLLDPHLGRELGCHVRGKASRHLDNEENEDDE